MLRVNDKIEFNIRGTCKIKSRTHEQSSKILYFVSVNLENRKQKEKENSIRTIL